MINPLITDDDDGNDNVLDLSIKKRLPVLLSPPSSTTSTSSSSSAKGILPTGKRMLDLTPPISKANKRPLRFQCKHCDYKAPSTSLMQNHIYRHTDLTPYACAYCGHKSTTKSTIMVHIELCHPNMEVKILENRVREQDFYQDLNNSEIKTLPETEIKKKFRSNQYDNESTPINGVAISLKSLTDDTNELSPTSDEIYDIDNLEPILIPTTDDHSLKLKYSPPLTPTIEDSKGPDSDDDSEYLLVYNRPKQYYGSLYEPDKQYACTLCSYTTNHRPSMEDHVFVHTNEKPYKCGYCGDEIFTRYAATYHIKYKHTGMPRNFIQNKTDLTQYYVNRAKKEEEKNQFKVVDTRRVKVPTRNGKSANIQQTKLDVPIEREPSPPSKSPPTSAPTTPDYRFLLAWSYLLATQTPWLSSMSQQQPGQSPLSLPTDPEAAAKFLQAMQTVMNPLTNNNNNHEPDSEQNRLSPIIKKEENEF